MTRSRQSDLRAAMVAVRELIRIVELLAKIQGELKEPGGTTVNVVYVNAPRLGKVSSGRYSAHAEPSELDGRTGPAELVIVDVSRQGEYGKNNRVALPQPHAAQQKVIQ